MLNGIESAFLYWGGIVERVVLDNTSLAVKDVLAGRDWVQTEAFERVPARVSVPGRPRLAVESFAALNAAILAELEADLPTRHLDDGRSAHEALTLERQHLRAMPAHLSRDLPRRRPGGRQIRTPAGGQSHLLGAEPTRLPAGVGELYHDRVRMLRLMETHPPAAVERAVAAALERQSPRLETVRSSSGSSRPGHRRCARR